MTELGLDIDKENEESKQPPLIVEDTDEAE